MTLLRGYECIGNAAGGMANCLIPARANTPLCQMEEAEAQGGFRSMVSAPSRVLAFGIGGVVLLGVCLFFQITTADD